MKTRYGHHHFCRCGFIAKFCGAGDGILPVALIGVRFGNDPSHHVGGIRRGSLLFKFEIAVDRAVAHIKGVGHIRERLSVGNKCQRAIAHNTLSAKGMLDIGNKRIVRTLLHGNIGHAQVRRVNPRAVGVLRTDCGERLLREILTDVQNISECIIGI